MSSKFKYNAAWETEFDWLKPSKMSDSYALCTFCKQYFKINGYGKSQIVRHAKSQNHLQIEKSRRKNNHLPIISPRIKSGVSPFSKLSKEEELINAEIIWTLQTIDCNYSFSSSYNDYCTIFKLMFPDSIIVKNFDMEKAKIKYLAQFGIVPHIEKIVKSDLLGSPFSFILDETTTIQVKKQYDAYIQYWSNFKDNFVPAIYCGSIFVASCRTDVLKNNFFEFIKKINVDCSLLIQVSTTSSNASTKFHKLVLKDLEDCHFTSLLDIGTPCVYPVCTAIKKGLTYVNFAYEEFLNDLIYFFKFSSLRKEDDKCLSSVAEVSHKFFLGQTPSKWLFLKPALTKILEQYKNIRDYFFIFLPKQENFKREIEYTNKYKSMLKLLKDRRTLIYINFIINVTSLFEPLLFDFLKREPLTHLLHENLSKLLFDLMSNFLKRSVLVKAAKRLDGDELSQIDCKNNNLYLQNVVLNLNTKKEIGLSSLNSKAIADIQNEFLQFYVESTSYLQNKLPLSATFLKDIKHFHPQKRNADAISRICKTVVNAIRNENVLNRLFHTQGKDKNSLCDIISNQAKMYVLEKDLPHDNLQDHWKNVSQLKNNLGEKKYFQLYTLAKCVMILNHGNSASERGCIINHNVLEKNKNIADEEAICAIRIIKDYLNYIGGIEHFVINREIIKSVKMSQKRYNDYVAKRKKKKIK